MDIIMDKKQLGERLQQENINEYYYSLDGDLPNEAFCLHENNNHWEVYYSEKGNKSQLKSFESEEDACNYFYNWVMKIFKKI